MNTILLALAVGGLYMATRKPKKAGRQTTNLPAGDYQIGVDEEFSLLMPRDTGYWTETTFGGDVKVFNKPGDSLTVGRVQGVGPGPVKVQYYADEKKTDLVSEYMFQVVGTRATRPSRPSRPLSTRRG